MKGTVLFYEKPGCRGNAKQKQLLIDAGYKLDVVDMVGKKWQQHELSPFLGADPVHECVNPNAPPITSGQFNPAQLSQEELLAAMIADPILIKRPLLAYQGEYACGFNNELVERLLGAPQEDTKCAKTDDCAPQ